MKYANGACCPWIPEERVNDDEYCYDDVDFMELKPKHRQQQMQTPGMAYVPMQVLNTLYDPEEGFCQGTIFPELNKPWLVGGVNCG